MCGIITVFSKKDKLDIVQCDRALDRLKLRGPDFSYRELYFDNKLYFGQSVLSITGNPINMINTYHKSRNSRFDIVLNGEIYNYRELDNNFLRSRGYKSFSGTDTELLINLHEVELPEEIYKKLKGMFAYVIYDIKMNKLIIGRDIIGEKIMYYYEDDDVLIVSSEIGPILELKPSISINRDVLREYFFTRHLLTPEDTVFNGIRLIKAGHLLEYNLDDMQFNQVLKRELYNYIDPGVIEKNRKRSNEDILEEFEAILLSTAKSLVPISRDYFSVFSGGIDSSLSSIYLSECKEAKEYIALTFPEKDNVSSQIGEFAKVLRRSIYAKTVDPESFAVAFDNCYKATCTPLPTHSFVSQSIMSKVVRENGVKVLIGGDGADELFGGYEFYKKLGSHHDMPDYNPSAYSGFIDYGVKFDNWKPISLVQTLRDRWGKYSGYYQFEKDPRERMLQTVLYSDSVIQLESAGIRSADAMSLVNSVESRCFYLSNEMLEFALNLPACFKINLDSKDETIVTKPLLKNAFCRKFGKELLLPKQGFSGYPNEAGRTMIDNNFPLTRDFLDLTDFPTSNDQISQALEWKLINMEFFLGQFKKHIQG
jgi:asparagine synthase (glutamine-hydrolysing)